MKYRNINTYPNCLDRHSSLSIRLCSELTFMQCWRLSRHFCRIMRSALSTAHLLSFVKKFHLIAKEHRSLQQSSVNQKSLKGRSTIDSNIWLNLLQLWTPYLCDFSQIVTFTINWKLDRVLTLWNSWCEDRGNVICIILCYTGLFWYSSMLFIKSEILQRGWHTLQACFPINYETPNLHQLLYSSAIYKEKN